MDSPQPIPEPSANQPARKKRRSIWWLFLMPAALLLLAAMFLVFEPQETTFAWLTREQMSQASRPTRMKEKIRTWVYNTIIRRYRGDRPNIYVGTKRLELSSVEADTWNLGPTASTNVTGMRAWTLSPEAYNALKQHLASASNSVSHPTPTVLTGDGTSAAVFSGQKVPVGSGYGNAGLSIDLIPWVAPDSVKLLTSVTMTEPKVADGAVQLQTNIFFACRVVVPDGGCLLVDTAGATNGSGQRDWFIIAPKLVDKNGTPVKR